ncbi:hypothetical protein L6R52_33835 [Myxococcota bacterium]|nr:hypothetical protein [Myxococcota bacterium]
MKTRKDVDGERAGKLLRGEEDLAGALGLDAAQLDELRAHAIALYDAEKWARAIDVLIAVSALAPLEPWELVILARAHRELGDHASAAAWGAKAEEKLTELQLLLAHPKFERI